MQDFRNLLVWQKAHRVTLAVWAAAAKLPPGPAWALQSQLTRRAMSVPANIAEGCGRAGNRAFRRFLRHSLGSACELEYHLLLARDLGLLPDRSCSELTSSLIEVKRMLGGLIRKVTDESQRDGTS